MTQDQAIIDSLTKCECCELHMDRDAYDQHWQDRERIATQHERIQRLEAALLIVAAIDKGLAAQIAKKVMNIG